MTTAARCHVPLRTCIACGRNTEKSGLLRLVTLDGGWVIVDTTGKQSGRGAYICAAGDCRSKEPNKNRVEYALKTTVGEDAWHTLVATLVATAPGG